jgi:hypothetical protein
MLIQSLSILKGSVNIANAKWITDEAIAEFSFFHQWYGIRDAGLVYDNTGKLAWDGIREARKQRQAESIVYDR